MSQNWKLSFSNHSYLLRDRNLYSTQHSTAKGHIDRNMLEGIKLRLSRLLVGCEKASSLYGTELQRKTGESLRTTINHQLIQSIIRRHVGALLGIAP